jgi:hypothetical protein|tara:strand:- start:1 stop:309 length:309 start_codon:yes stop_codon:yes gene_type:complete
VVYEIFFRAETTKGMGDPSEFIAVTGRPDPTIRRGCVAPPKNDGGCLITGYDIEVQSTVRSYTFIGNLGTGYFLMVSAAHTITAAHYISVRGRMLVFIAQSG